MTHKEETQKRIEQILYEAKDLFEKAETLTDTDPGMAVLTYGQVCLRATIALNVAKDAAGHPISHPYKDSPINPFKHGVIYAREKAIESLTSTVTELQRLGFLSNEPRIFGVGGREPITVFWTGDVLQPVRFNEDSLFVVSVNGGLTNASSVITGIHGSLPASLVDAVVFELFSGPGSAKVAIEIGSRVPRDLAAVVLKSCVRNGVGLGDTYRMPEDGRFGYCQRVYIGSLSPTGVLMDSDAISDLLNLET